MDARQPSALRTIFRRLPPSFHLDILLALYAVVTGVISFGAGALAGKIATEYVHGAGRVAVVIVTTLVFMSVAGVCADFLLDRARAWRRSG